MLFAIGRFMERLSFDVEAHQRYMTAFEESCLRVIKDYELRLSEANKELAEVKARELTLHALLTDVIGGWITIEQAKAWLVENGHQHKG